MKVGKWALAAVLFAAAPMPLVACEAAGELVGIVASFAAPDIVRLADGGAVRLAGAIMGKDVVFEEAVDRTLLFSASWTDRRGRPVGQAFLAGAPPAWLQGELVGRGLALADGRAEGPCAEELIAREAEAERSGAGIWADPAGLVHPARDTDRLLERTGRFAIVEGEVVSVGERPSTTYLNFGTYWRYDFTVTVSGRDRDIFAETGLDLASLAGQTIRVRGWIRDDRGPAIEATLPEQIQIVHSR